jgi:hypothetical protein
MPPKKSKAPPRPSNKADVRKFFDKRSAPWPADDRSAQRQRSMPAEHILSSSDNLVQPGPSATSSSKGIGQTTSDAFSSGFGSAKTEVSETRPVSSHSTEETVAAPFAASTNDAVLSMVLEVTKKPLNGIEAGTLEASDAMKPTVGEDEASVAKRIFDAIRPATREVLAKGTFSKDELLSIGGSIYDNRQGVMGMSSSLPAQLHSAFTSAVPQVLRRKKFREDSNSGSSNIGLRMSGQGVIVDTMKQWTIKIRLPGNLLSWLHSMALSTRVWCNSPRLCLLFYLEPTKRRNSSKLAPPGWLFQEDDSA